jgi:NADH:ubiquinone oxidoreductase subunit
MSEKISLVTWMANIQIRLFTWRRGKYVATDRFGNRYFRDKKTRPGARERRWVLFNGEPEATKIPPEWHCWMHHTRSEPLPEGTSPFHKPWQQEHVPNPSGSVRAYLQPGHPLKGGQRPRTVGDYEPWIPS